MRRERVSAARIMKYVVLLLTVVYIVLLMLYASGSSRPFEEVGAEVAAALDAEVLSEQDAARLKRNFGLNAADFDGVMYYASESNVSAEEVLLIKVSRDSQVRQVTAALERRLASRENDFEGYAPEQERMLKDAVQSVRGSYVFFAVSPDAGEYLSAFNRSL